MSTKSIMRGAVKRAKMKFNKIDALQDAIEVGGHIGMAARKDKRKLADSWVKRSRTDPGDLHNRAAAREAKRAPVTITRML